MPDPLWRVLIERDVGRRFPGCDAPGEMCDAHHTAHKADGGDTSADNLVLLC